MGCKQMKIETIDEPSITLTRSTNIVRNPFYDYEHNNLCKNFCNDEK